jgi:UDP-N-acetylmuramate--alanine ligase
VVEVVTNIDLEHLDYYSGIEQIKEVFLEFINKIPFYGAAVLCLDDGNIVELLPKIKKRVITYGLTAQADIHARDIRTCGLTSLFEVCAKGKVLGEIELKLAGVHNVYNALAAVAVGVELDISFDVIKMGLASFTGVRRRLEVKGEVNGIIIVDDYGHHPTEVRATLAAMRLAWPRKRLVVLFQPHRYTRTQALMKEFSMAFHDADLLFMCDIYPASEEPIAGVNSLALIEQIQVHGQKNVHYVADLNKAADQVLPHLESDDVFLTLGAGNIWQSGEQVIDTLQKLNATSEPV